MSKAPRFLSGGVTSDPWDNLKRLTAARVALGRAGVSLPTSAHLEFQLAHAEARDAVHACLDAEQLAEKVRDKGLTCFVGRSSAADREEYLQRPDLGRTLDEDTKKSLSDWQEEKGSPEFDLSIVISDGLSARAVRDHSLPMLANLITLAEEEGWSLSPVVIARQGRVAIGDEIGHQFSARMVVLMIGERPGLSSPDSLGIYFTFQPKPGLKDDSRNCISNIRPEGLSYALASHKLAGLLRGANERRLSGVQLKDDSELVAVDSDIADIGNFLAIADIKDIGDS
ncbi:MAG: ethanolamine ammonia-lyase subunit EutC [Pseudomonadota bacterium]|nr:ethanolamine ammonia-lyase subunit EutC [Pseudomonadota bacterium]